MAQAAQREHGRPAEAVSGNRSPAAGGWWTVVAELVVLAGLLALLGRELVPAHGTSIWNDYEFSGWVAPLANRLAGGERLYVDGSRSPMPPLPTVGLRLATGGQARWIDESRWNFLLQVAALLVLYAGLSRALPRPVAWLAVLTATPLFLALPKGILYDSLSQFLVAAVVAVSLFWAARWKNAAASRDGWADWLFPAALGALVTTLLLSKTSTVAGTGVATAWLVLAAPAANWRRRVLRLVVFGGSALAVLALWLAVLSPYVSPEGFVEDVLLHGSEPKGGPRVLAVRFAGMLVQLALGLALTGMVVLFALGWIGRRPSPDSSVEEPALGWQVLAYPAALAGLAAAGAYFLAGPERWVPALETALFGGIGAILGLGLFAVVTLGLAASTGIGRSEPLVRLGAALGLPGLVALGAALTHSLSVATFRWTYDNNPLVVLALAAFYLGLLPSVGMWPAGRLPRAAGGAALFLAVAMTACGAAMMLKPKLLVTRDCTEVWPEVAFLSGARLRPEARGMRELVATVRRLAPDAERDVVALLPNDPNVESWFERPRWPSAAAIVFADQYWDRYVDGDFERLRAAPPKVIVIGPRDEWRGFSRHWHRKAGTERLIDRVQKELLRQKYKPPIYQPITYRHRTDYMDVYVRRE